MKKGFTLIELLVVVLIIGILSAVAMPEYTKAVWKARAAELRTATRMLATAQEAYFLANGGYPKKFDEMDLDISLPNKGLSSRCGLTTQDSRGNQQYELIVNNNAGNHFLSSSMFLEGPYQCGGFTFAHDPFSVALNPGTMYCWEWRGSGFTQTPGAFCEKVMQGTYKTIGWGYRLYEIP